MFLFLLKEIPYLLAVSPILPYPSHPYMLVTTGLIFVYKFAHFGLLS